MSQFLRGAVRLHILHHANIEPFHGAWMGEELASHGYRISPGTLYPMLQRMQEDGLLISRHQLVDGHARRVYEITDLGRAALTEERMALAALAGEILDDHRGTSSTARTDCCNADSGPPMRDSEPPIR